MTKLIYEYYSPQGLKLSKQFSNSSRLIIKEAEKRGITWRVIPGTRIVILSYRGKEKSFYNQVPSSTTALAHYACTNKGVTSNILRQAGVNIPKGFHIKRDHNREYLTQIFNSLTKPLAVKPTHGTWGENITLNISDFDEYLKAVDLALGYSLKKSSGAVVEEMFEGQEYRILATRDKVIGVLNRIPAHVTGDGKHTIVDLVKVKNQEPIRGKKGSHKSHVRIRVDQRVRDYLAEQGLSVDSVPNVGQQVFLRRVSNTSQGGEAIDYTDLVHPSVNEIALKAIRAVPGLSFAGLDFMTADITKPQSEDSYVIIEINDSPGFDIHDQPYRGKNRHAAREFLYLLFPELKGDS